MSSISADNSKSLSEAVTAAFHDERPLQIHGSGSKQFYGRQIASSATVVQQLDMGSHGGIVSYEPTELVITARAGTPLAEIEKTLAQEHQMLAFEPPHYGEGATLGGTIACNLSGPRRAYAGAARDFVLGMHVINGKGEMLHFGGEVMKNVAGYDVSRLMTGAMGTLGILLDVSLKVLPLPETEITLSLELTAEQALQRLHEWGRQGLPLSACCFDGGRLLLRLSGNEATVAAACDRVGGDQLADGDQFWYRLKEHRTAFFDAEKPLWRVSLASNSAPLALGGSWIYEWSGALRWLSSDEPAGVVRAAVNKRGGHATLFRGTGSVEDEIFHPLPAALFDIHRRLKQAFDPAGILNPGRMYAGL